MNKQLLLFHNAVSAYFSGNNVALEAAVRHFNIQPAHATPAPAPRPLSLPLPLPDSPPTLPSNTVPESDSPPTNS